MQPICTYELRLVCERSLVSVRSSIYAKSAHKSAIATAIDVALANRMRLVLDWTGPEGTWGIMLGAASPTAVDASQQAALPDAAAQANSPQTRPRT